MKKVQTFSILLLISLFTSTSFSFFESYPKLDSEHISKDLINHKLNGWTFKESDFLGINIHDEKYDDEKAIVYIFFRVIDNKVKYGKEGKLRLEYEYAAKDWNLLDIKSIRISNLHNNLTKWMGPRNMSIIKEIKPYPLHFAATIGDLERVKELIADGANINKLENKYGSVPLNFASQFNNINIMRVLIENGADVNALNNYGGIPLHSAVAAGHVEAVDLLIEKGADVNHADNYRRTPLDMATRMHSLDVIRLLELQGAMIFQNKSHILSINNDLTDIGKFNSITFNDIIKAPLSRIKINGINNENNQVTVGSIFFMKTDKGNYSKFIIQKYGIQNGWPLTLSWTTYDEKGGIYSYGQHLTIKKACDLDSGKELSDIGGEEDFWWQPIEGSVGGYGGVIKGHYLTPMNGAAIVRVDFEK